MRICVLIDAWIPMWGGGQVHVWEINKRLVKNKNYQVDIFTRKLLDSSGEKYIKNSSFYNNRLNIIRVGPTAKFFTFFVRILWLATVTFRVLKENKKKKYDLIHAHAYLSGIPAKLLGIFLGIPVVFTVHGSNNLDLNRNSLITFIERLLLTAIHYDLMISVTYCFTKYKNVNTPIYIIPNGVTLKNFSLRRSKLRVHTPKVLWVGRLEWIKGLDVLLQALCTPILGRSKITLFVAGQGELRQEIVKQVYLLRLQDKVKIMGNKTTKELAKLYSASDLLVISSRSEGLPLVLFEAWAAKLPVIATAVGDIPRYIKPGINGYIVKPENPNSLAEALRAALNNKDLPNLGRQGYEYVKKYCTWEKAVEKTVEVYAKLN